MSHLHPIVITTTTTTTIYNLGIANGQQYKDESLLQKKNFINTTYKIVQKKASSLNDSIFVNKKLSSKRNFKN